jgi:hypothetical protein
VQVVIGDLRAAAQRHGVAEEGQVAGHREQDRGCAGLGAAAGDTLNEDGEPTAPAVPMILSRSSEKVGE